MEYGLQWLLPPVKWVFLVANEMLRSKFRSVWFCFFVHINFSCHETFLPHSWCGSFKRWFLILENKLNKTEMYNYMYFLKFYLNLFLISFQLGELNLLIGITWICLQVCCLRVCCAGFFCLAAYMCYMEICCTRFFWLAAIIIILYCLQRSLKLETCGGVS